jgi:two-component system, chemotaxis family, protein-glutamate methylesterase/glutaminase
MRQVLGDLLRSDPDIDVVGFARDGAEAVRMTSDLKPDVVTLDVEMPRMDGLEALASIMTVAPTPVIMVSTLTSQGAQATLEALDRGAVDFVCKPRSGSLLAIREVREELLGKVRSAKDAALGRRLRRGIPAAAPVRASDRVILIASSTGGPKALTCLFETLPRDLAVPVLIVQHMPPGFTEGLAKRLDRMGNLSCREAHERDRVTPGLALMAPGGRHMSVTASGEIELSDGPPVHGVRPAADILFGSAAKAFGTRCVAAVLTGMGKDGAEGALEIRNAGGHVYGESEQTCTVYGMPRAAKLNGATEAEFPIHEIGHAIVANLSRRPSRAA